MRVLVAVTAAMLFLLFAVALCVQEDADHGRSSHELTLEREVPTSAQGVRIEEVACATCLESSSETLCYCDHIEETRIVPGPDSVFKLPLYDDAREAASSKVEVGAVGVLL